MKHQMTGTALFVGGWAAAAVCAVSLASPFKARATERPALRVTGIRAARDPDTSPTEVSPNPSSINGGQQTTVTVTVSPTPTSDTQIDISSLHASAFSSLPSSVTVLSGNTTAQFHATAADVMNGVDADISAAANGTRATGYVAIAGSPR